jgi:hypothetical protein
MILAIYLSLFLTIVFINVVVFSVDKEMMFGSLVENIILSSLWPFFLLLFVYYYIDSRLQ